MGGRLASSCACSGGLRYAARPVITPASIQRIGRYRVDGTVHHGRLVESGWERLTAAPWAGGEPTGQRDADSAIELLAPCEPTKILCIGLNYRAHVAESLTVTRDAAGRAEEPEEPLFFLKPPSAALAHGGEIRYPAGVTRLDPEAEMAVVIARRARAVNEADALAYVAGVTCFNDMSARNYQKSDGQWARAKGFDTFAPIGPWIATGLPPDDLQVECRVNGVRRQLGRTRDLIFPVPRLIAFLSRVMTLEPGDVIATGTPAGIAPVEPGDRIEVEVEGVGTLANHVARLIA